MKNSLKYPLMLLAFLFCLGLSACGNDEPENRAEPDVIYIPSGDKQAVTLRYDQSETPNAIKFESTGDWTAEIYPANSNFEILDSKSFSKVDWLEISPYAGSAGSWSCELFSAPNRDPQSRYAVVILNSIKSQIKYKITQEGMPSGGGGSIIPNPEN